MSSKITTTPVKNCAVCKKKIVSRDYLKCMTCNRFIDVTCTSNITLNFFRIMTNKTKDVWKCHLCTGKGKRTSAVRLQQKTSAEFPPPSLKSEIIRVHLRGFMFLPQSPRLFMFWPMCPRLQQITT